MQAQAFTTIAGFIGAAVPAIGAAVTSFLSSAKGARRTAAGKATLGPYALEQEIGHGGMGVVYRASHAQSGRAVAVKLLRASASTGAAAIRFEREVQITARLSHPNTVSVLDHGRAADGTFYYAMEYLDGITLHDLVEREGPQLPARVAHILEQLCGALAEAHALGLVHRDVKPANIMLTRRGGELDVVKLLDFGLAKERTGGVDPTLSANAILGTPHYMAPETILDASDVDGRADLYALGAVAYYLLTGEQVFDGANLVELCSQHLHEAPSPPSQKNGAVSPELDAIVLACLAKGPDDRPRDADALAAMLRHAEVGAWRPEDAKTAWATRRSPARSGALEIGLAATLANAEAA